MLASKVAIENRLLRQMQPDDFALLAPHFKLQEFAVRYEIEKPDTPISEVIFLESGLASIVARKTVGRDIEVGISGFDGMTGTTLLLGAAQTPHATFVQIAGRGNRISAQALQEVMATSKTLRDYLLLYVHTLMVQTASTALANSQFDVESRLARWLLMIHDRTRGMDLFLTHEFLSIMLGVRRPWVTVALHVLEGKGFIRSRRGQITIADRKGLLEQANDSYGVAEREYERVFSVELARR